MLSDRGQRPIRGQHPLRRGRHKNKKPHLHVFGTGGYKHLPPKEPPQRCQNEQQTRSSSN